MKHLYTHGSIVCSLPRQTQDSNRIRRRTSDQFDWILFFLVNQDWDVDFKLKGALNTTIEAACVGASRKFMRSESALRLMLHFDLPRQAQDILQWELRIFPVCGTGGKLTKLVVTPQSRKADVQVHNCKQQ